MPIKHGSGEHAELCAARMAEREHERKERARLVRVKRRRWLLWTPLALVGAVLLVWQLTSDMPIPLLVYVGIVMLLPTVVDV
jgi:hypothetical protein